MNEYKLRERELQNKIQHKEKIKQKLSALNLSLKPKDYAVELQDIQKKILILEK